MKTDRKKKTSKLPKLTSYRPPKSVKTKFIRILPEWRTLVFQRIVDGLTMHVEIVMSPSKKFYRRAFSWEQPSLVIDSNILPAEHHIRLTRVRDKTTLKMVRKALRRELKKRRTG